MILLFFSDSKPFSFFFSFHLLQSGLFKDLFVREGFTLDHQFDWNNVSVTGTGHKARPKGRKVPKGEQVSVLQPVTTPPPRRSGGGGGGGGGGSSAEVVPSGERRRRSDGAGGRRLRDGESGGESGQKDTAGRRRRDDGKRRSSKKEGHGKSTDGRSTGRSTPARSSSLVRTVDSTSPLRSPLNHPSVASPDQELTRGDISKQMKHGRSGSRQTTTKRAGNGKPFF